MMAFKLKDVRVN